MFVTFNVNMIGGGVRDAIDCPGSEVGGQHCLNVNFTFW